MQLILQHFAENTYFAPFLLTLCFYLLSLIYWSRTTKIAWKALKDLKMMTIAAKAALELTQDALSDLVKSEKTLMEMREKRDITYGKQRAKCARYKRAFYAMKYAKAEYFKEMRKPEKIFNRKYSQARKLPIDKLMKPFQKKKSCNK